MGGVGGVGVRVRCAAPASARAEGGRLPVRAHKCGERAFGVALATPVARVAGFQPDMEAVAALVAPAEGARPGVLVGTTIDQPQRRQGGDRGGRGHTQPCASSCAQIFGKSHTIYGTNA